MLLATALALLIQDVPNRRLLFKTNRVAPKEPSPIISSFLNWAEENCRCSQNLWRCRNDKTENPANIRKWIARFYYFRHLVLTARVLLTHCMSCLSIWATYLHCSLIYFWVPSSCFCIVISLLRAIIPFSGVCQSGEVRLSTPRR